MTGSKSESDIGTEEILTVGRVQERLEGTGNAPGVVTRTRSGQGRGNGKGNGTETDTANLVSVHLCVFQPRIFINICVYTF